MKKIKLGEGIRIVGIKNFAGEDKLIDYYLMTQENEKFYAFSKVYTHHTYAMCKSGVRANDLLRKKSRDVAVMRLVKYTRLILPYLMEYYDLSEVA